MRLQKTALIVAVACPLLFVTAAGADFSTSFDSSEGYTTGTLPGQQGWVDVGTYNPNRDEVVNAPVQTGDQALIPGGRTKHTVNGPLSGVDVIMQAGFYYGGNYSEDVDAYWWDVMSSSGALNGYVVIARNRWGPDGDGYYVMGQGNPAGGAFTDFQKVEKETWYTIKMRFLWDGVSSYNKYDLWIDGEKKTGDGGFNLENPMSDISQVLTIYAAKDYPYSAYTDDLFVAEASDVIKPGDANSDGLVNAADAAILAGNWLKTGMGWGDGNFNGDDVVDDKDATLMATNWSGSGATNVPEPGTVIMLSALGLALAAMRRWR